MAETSTGTSALYRHIRLVGTRPKIFLGGHGVDLLSANLYGWKAHRHHFPDGDGWADRFYATFHKFVAARYGERRNMDWHAIIKAQEPDPRRQMALFYDLLEAFCEGCAP